MNSCRKVVIGIVLIILSSAYGDLENELAKINKEGYPGSFLFEAIQLDSNVVTAQEFKNRLDSPKIQTLLITRALNYASSKISDEDKQNYTSTFSRGLWDDYCAYGWIRWLSFMNCAGGESITSDEDSEEFNKVEIINQGKGVCYRKPIPDD